MSNDANICVFTGRIGKDPELKHLPQGEAITTFSLAVGRRWKDKQSGDPKSDTTWLDCVAVGREAENIAKLCKVGSFILIEAEYRVRKWHKDGKDHSRSEHLVQKFQMLDRRGDNPGPGVMPSAPDRNERPARPEPPPRANLNQNPLPPGEPAPTGEFTDANLPW